MRETSAFTGGSFILNTYIAEGAFQVARKIFSSKLWLTKPASWKVIWIYIIGKVNHTADKNHKEGEGFFNFTNECKLIGQDITPDMIKKFLQYGRRMAILSTIRSTRGLTLKVLNYKYYQDLSNYRSTTSSTKEAREKHSDRQQCKNVKNKDLSEKDKKQLMDKEENRLTTKEVRSLVRSIGVKSF